MVLWLCVQPKLRATLSGLRAQSLGSYVFTGLLLMSKSIIQIGTTHEAPMASHPAGPKWETARVNAMVSLVW